ncbi:MAG: tryptophan synthase subunit alpha [Candidatus Baltobacteraceae bacterium]
MKLDTIFQRAKKEGRVVFIPYLMAGDPDRDSTKLMLQCLHDAGADVVELGIPYGDPLADGPSIAAAGVRALKQDVRIDDVLQFVRTSPLPVVLFTYFNPVLQYGFERFAENAAAAGAAGVIVPDVALEEALQLRALLEARGLAMPLLVAPSTPLERAKSIARQSSGFIYVVSRLGVTGTGAVPDFEPLLKHVAELRSVTEKPLAVGFGLSRPEHMRAVAPFVDGVIVGSAFIDSYAGRTGANAADGVKQLANILLSAGERLEHSK